MNYSKWMTLDQFRNTVQKNENEQDENSSKKQTTNPQEYEEIFDSFATAEV